MVESGCDYCCRTVGEGIAKYDILDSWCAEFDVCDDVFPTIVMKVGQVRKNHAIMGLRLRIVDNTDLGAQTVRSNIISRSYTLVGVGKADLENVCTSGSNVGSGCRGSQHEDLVSNGLGSQSQSGSSGDRTCKDLHTPVLQGVVSIQSLLSVVLIVSRLELDLQIVFAGSVKTAVY